MSVTRLVTRFDMSRSFITGLLMILALVGKSRAVQEYTQNEPLSDGRTSKVYLSNLYNNQPYVQKILIAPASTTTFDILDIPQNVSFIIFQIHTHQNDVTLSYDEYIPKPYSNRSVTGSNIGLYIYTNSKKTSQIFLINDNSYEVDSLVVVTKYHSVAPIPGGCNMEFNTKVAPYEKVIVRDSVVVVDVQPASMPMVGGLQDICEKNPVQHEVYLMYLPGQDFSSTTYFSAIQKMLTVDDILKNGEKVPISYATSPMRRVLSAYTGVGSIYVAVATFGPYSAAYVPSFSYACNPVHDPESCKILHDGFSKVVCAFTFFVGLISVLIGHKSIASDTHIPILVVGTVIGYTVLLSTNLFSIPTTLGVALIIGISGTIAWSILRAALPGLASFIFCFTLGFLCACFIYFFGADNFVILHSNWIFWPLYTALLFVVSLIMVVLQGITHVITCALFGSLMTILPLDYLLGSVLKYILINMIRRMIEAEFAIAIVSPPIQATEIWLGLLWACLAVIRMIGKHCCSRGSPANAETTPFFHPDDVYV